MVVVEVVDKLCIGVNVDVVRLEDAKDLDCFDSEDDDNEDNDDTKDRRTNTSDGVRANVQACLIHKTQSNGLIIDSRIGSNVVVGAVCCFVLFGFILLAIMHFLVVGSSKNGNQR